MEMLSKMILLLVAISSVAACSYTMEEQARYDEIRAYWHSNNGKAGTGYGGRSSSSVSR